MKKTNSPDLINEEIKKLGELFPQFVSEGKVDIDGLQTYLQNEKVDGEWYTMNRHGKSQAKLIAREPSTATLRPDHKQSKDWDTTKNILIEGDNLEVLKLLQNKYYEQVKCIYIDPPYNKDKDFVYRDTWKDPVGNYMRITGQIDDEGEISTDIETTGRRHSNWLSMMYPRLYLARKLLKDDGVIFVSIDDDEVHNLKKLMDEIFDASNFLGQIVWETATDNNPSQLAIEHEYILCYAKDREHQDSREVKSEKSYIIQKKYEELLNEKLTIKEIEKKLKARISILKKTNDIDISGISHYSYVDEKGVYYPGNSNNTKPGNYQFDITHPISKKACKKPSNGWRRPKKTFRNADAIGDVEWGKDESTIPKIKKRLETATELLKGYFYEDNRIATAELANLFGIKVFNNPKSLNLLKKFFKFTTSNGDIILDFFAGSGTTGHAVMDLNAEDNGNRQYILVQLPELIQEKEEAYKAGYRKISEITRDRLIKAGEKINKGDTGFRFLSLSTSNFQDLDPISLKEGETTEDQLFDRIALEYDAFGIKQDRSDDDIIYELLVRYGYSLHSHIGQDITFKKRYKITDDTVQDKEFFLSLESKVSDEVIAEFVKIYHNRSNIVFVCKDDAISPSSRLTLANYFPGFTTI